MPKQLLAKLLKKEQLTKDIFKFSVQAKEIVDISKPGNFIEIRVSDQTEPFLRRPISIYNLEKEEEILEFIFQVKGKGTKILMQKKQGDLIDIIGPLGYGTFKTEGKKRIAIIGGGIGIFPLQQLAKQAKLSNIEIDTYLGFRNKEYVMLEDEFKKVSDNLIITTDDGTYGKNGFAINYLEENLKNSNYDAIYACGPLPMLRAVQKLSIKNNIEAQISLEEKMACGLGVCLGCAVKTSKSSKDSPMYLHVCKAGPVFNAKDVEF